MTDIYQFFLQDTLLKVVGMIIMVCVILSLFEVRRTKKYRIELSDMYVSAKIRQIADKDGIDLNKEYKNFQSWNKKRKMEENSFRFDDVVEEDLKDKVIDKEETKAK